jgi:hypothetical protein
MYAGHGSWEGPGGIISIQDMQDKQAKLNPGIAVMGACSTCAHSVTNNYCIQNLRRGMMETVGAVDKNYNIHYFDIMFEAYRKSEPIGKSFRKAKLSNKNGFLPHENIADFNYVLIGDPTFKPR